VATCHGGSTRTTAIIAAVHIFVVAAVGAGAAGGLARSIA
jgi:hypothetical protein